MVWVVYNIVSHLYELLDFLLKIVKFYLNFYSYSMVVAASSKLKLKHLPIADIEKGLEFIESTFTFEDERANNFKEEIIKYIRNFWIQDVFLLVSGMFLAEQKI